MQYRAPQTERVVALVLLATLVFNYPLLSLFGGPVLVFGVPVLYLYLFVAWAVLIGLIRGAMKKQSPNQSSGTESPRKE